jgi:hypothetical protein
MYTKEEKDYLNKNDMFFFLVFFFLKVGLDFSWREEGLFNFEGEEYGE